jgi:hypothetical protein
VANFMAFAPDGLTSVGGYPGDDDRGGQLFGKVDRAKMGEDLYAKIVGIAVSKGYSAERIIRPSLAMGP